MKHILDFLNNVKNIKPILNEIEKKGGVSYLVGGSVRDLLLAKPVKDFDIEVHKISLEELKKCLENFGEVKFVGQQFGVLKLINKKDSKILPIDIDWSLPRKDSLGRKPKVEIDPDMTIEQACRRRDLTINAMAINLNDLIGSESISDLGSIKIIDPYGGQKDLKNKILRAVDEDLFLQDPLRFFRVMQFIGRFEMTPDENLNKICKSMSFKDLETDKVLSKERIYTEIQKLFLKSERPSLGFRWLKKINRLKDIFPELYDLVRVKQRKDYHPEGDVFEHTMQCFDAAAIFDKYENESEKFAIMLAVLCHDLGKPQTTDEELHSFAHEKTGEKIAKKFLKRFIINKELIEFACKLVFYHVRPGLLIEQKAGLKAYKKLAAKLSPQISMRQLAILALADWQGRNQKSSEPLKMVGVEKYNLFLQRAKEAQVEHEAEKPVLLGRHLLGIVKPGPEMGKFLKKAYEIQIEENIKDVEELKKRALK
ncbi:MAG: HD domain-containing protein [bacterium]